MNGSLHDQKVLVIGRGSGIARAVAVAARDAGAHVIAAGRDQEKLADAYAGEPGISTETVDVTDEESIAARLYTAGLPDPDLLIRTSGEKRVSNFLLWQIAYAELYVTDTLWPDFRTADLLNAILDYQKRDRRFGGLSIDAGQSTRGTTSREEWAEAVGTIAR